jgi:hypothetical protein
MRWLVTVCKHINDIPAIARQPSITTIEGMLKAMFSVGSVSPRYIVARNSVQLSAVQLSEVKWFVGERESSVVSWKSGCEEKTRRLVWNGRQPGTPLTVESSSARKAEKRWGYRRVYTWQELSCGIFTGQQRVNTEARVSSLLRSVTRKRLVKQTGKT